MTADVLVVDNHDSFVHTLVGYLHQLGVTTRMVEADALDAAALEAGDADALGGYRGILVSPGPGAPADAGASVDVVRAASARGIPLLGVCLGHQAIAEAFGARVGHAPELMHGMTSEVRHDGSALYEGLADPFTATRYHSLAIERETLPPELKVTAETDSGVIMGIAHASAPVLGVQFHPESVLTDGGHRLLGNWLETLGVAGAGERGAQLSPRR